MPFEKAVNPPLPLDHGNPLASFRSWLMEGHDPNALLEGKPICLWLIEHEWFEAVGEAWAAGANPNTRDDQGRGWTHWSISTSCRPGCRWRDFEGWTRPGGKPTSTATRRFTCLFSISTWPRPWWFGGGRSSAPGAFCNGPLTPCSPPFPRPRLGAPGRASFDLDPTPLVWQSLAT